MDPLPIPDSPDPKLKAAMGEIEAILKRHQILGYIELHSQDGTEFQLFVEAPWSAMRREQAGYYRFKAAMKTGDDAEKMKGAHTAGFIQTMAILAVQHLKNCMALAEMVDKHMEIKTTIKDVTQGPSTN